MWEDVVITSPYTCLIIAKVNNFDNWQNEIRGSVMRRRGATPISDKRKEM